MNRLLLATTFAATLLTFAAPNYAALVISEVVANEIGSDTDGEWFEIYNNGAVAIDLSNYKIGDEETAGATSETEGMYQFPAGASIGPGVVQIVAVNANQFFEHYGFLPTYENAFSDATGPGGDHLEVPNLVLYAAWDPDGTRINAANGNDQILVLDGSDNVVDAVNWGNTFFLDPGLAATAGNGESYERINPGIDTNTAADWRIGNPATPGTVPVPEPASAALAVGALALFVRRRRSNKG